MKNCIGGVLFASAIAAQSLAAPLLTMQLDDVLLAPNGTAALNVTVTGTGEQVSVAGYEFRIAPVAGTSSQLRFVEETEGFLTSGNYLFAGNSAALTDAVPSSVGAVSTTILPDDTFVGGDSTANLGDVVVNGMKLLVRLLVAHDAGPVEPVNTFGHSFTVTATPILGDSSGLLSGTTNTGFLSSSFSGVPYESLAGTLTIAVPEPAGSVVLLLCVAAAVLHSIRQQSTGWARY